MSNLDGQPVGFDPHRAYRIKELSKAWPCSDEFIYILIRCGLVTLRPSPNGKERILGSDWIDALHQVSEANNKIDLKLYKSIFESRSEKAKGGDFVKSPQPKKKPKKKKK